MGVQSFHMTPQIFIQTSLHMVATSLFISLNVFTFMSFNLIPAYYVIVCILAKKCSAVAKMGDHSATIDMGQNWGRGCAPFWVWGAGSPCNTMWPGPRPTFAPSGILIHPAVWQQQTWAENWMVVPPFWGGELGPHLTQCRLGRGLPPTNWHLDPSSRLVTTDMG